MALFRKKKIEQVETTPIVEGHAVKTPTTGPWDASDRDTTSGYFDFGPLRVPAQPGIELHSMRVPGQKLIPSLKAVAGTSAVLFTVVADRKSGGIRQELIELTEQQCAAQELTVKRGEGPWGTELIVQPKEKGLTPSRLLFVAGPRWVLKLQIMGQATIDESAREIIDSIIHDVVVYRDDAPRPAGTIIPLVIPDPTVQVEEDLNGGG